MSSGTIYIKASRDFKKTIKEGRINKSPHFVFYSTLREPTRSMAGGSARLGISVSRASVPLASRRNRIKRVLREAWRKKDINKKSPKEIVVIVRRGTERLKNEEITKEVTSALNKILS